MAAHGFGWLAVRLHQPRVAGEILGGLLLGPTLFGLLLPDWQQAIFHGGAATQAGLGIAYQLGLLLLMYCSGTELRSILSRAEGQADPSGSPSRATCSRSWPASALLNWTTPTASSAGPTTALAFALVFALAMAVTSIPVISRIMADLGILGTRFARVVLSVAVLEDLPSTSSSTSRWPGCRRRQRRDLRPPRAARPGERAARRQRLLRGRHPAFFVLPVGARARAWCSGWPTGRATCCSAASPVAFQLVLLLALTGLAAFMGVAPIFGALVAGILACDLRGEDEEARQTISGVAYASFIPLYFAVVGLRLDLVGHFEPLFFLFLLPSPAWSRRSAAMWGPGWPARAGRAPGTWRWR